MLWASYDRRLLPPAADAILSDEANDLTFSTVSIWEIAIKHSLGRDRFYADPVTLRNRLLLAGYHELPVKGVHAVNILRLPMLHKDPFDRLLLAQAMVEELTLVTADAVLAKYPGPVMKV